MLQKRNWKENAGSLMIEAMAMLALIAMVTPVLYKKAAERTTELKDINAASQMRVMITAVDNYIKDHYSEIMNGDPVTTDCANADSQNFDAFKNDQSGAVKLDNLAHLCEYLPYGFVDADGNIRGSNTFSDFQLSISKRVSDTNPENSSLTGFLLGNPSSPLSMLRASRIASMIGSNGGYTEGQTGNGVQGVWKIDDLDDVGLESQSDGSILTASIQSITKGSVMNEDVLYRVDTGDPRLNTMETTLYMGGNNIEDVNQIIIDNADGASDALKIENGGAEIAGELTAGGGNFAVDSDGNATRGDANVNGNATITGDTSIGGNASVGGDASVTGGLTAAGDKFKVEAATGNTSIGGDATITGGLSAAGDKFVVDKSTGDTTINANIDVTGNANIGGNTTIGGDLNVSGDTTLETLRVNQTSSFGGDATFEQNVTVENNLDVGGILSHPMGKNDKRLLKNL